MQAEILAGGCAKQPMFEASRRLGEFGLRGKSKHSNCSNFSEALIFWFFFIKKKEHNKNHQRMSVISRQ
jgi:hypothetical protein